MHGYPQEYSPPPSIRSENRASELINISERIQQLEVLIHNHRKWMNYANFMNAIISKVHHPLLRQIILLNCSVDCKNYTDATKRYISTDSEKLSETKLSRMLSEETNPPPELYTAITTGDFRKFDGEVYEPPTEAGFERILQNIDSYDEIEALISEVKSLIRNDETICSASKKKLLRSLKASPNKFEGQTIFLFECLKFVVENGNNTYVRRVKDQIRQLQKDARRLAGQFSMDSRLLYAEENKGEDYAISHENEPDNNTI